MAVARRLGVCVGTVGGGGEPSPVLGISVVLAMAGVVSVAGESVGDMRAAVGGRQLPLHALGEEPSLHCWAPEPPGLGRRPHSAQWPGIGVCLPFWSDSFPQVHMPPTPTRPAAVPADRHRRVGWAIPQSRAGRAQGRACITVTPRVCAVTCCGRRRAGRWHCKRGASQECCLPAPTPPNPRRPCTAFGCVPRV